MTPLDDHVTLTREELYEQVWAEPMWTLASRYGLSDVGLAKTCRRLKIPVPWRGYWQQKQAGQPVRQAKLPELSATLTESLATVTFQSPAARRAARGRRAANAEDNGAALQPIPVAEVLTEPHPLVAHTIKALRRAKPTREGLLPRAKAAEYLDVRVSLDTVDRTMRILDALLKVLDARGFSISVDLKGEATVTRAHVLDEVVPFYIDERVDHVPDAAVPPRRPGEWTPPPQIRSVPTGALAFHIDPGYLVQEAGQIRKSWSDGKQQRLEDCLPRIIVGLVEAANGLKITRRIQEENQRRWKEEERRRKYTAWESRQEKRRREALNDELELWRLCEELRVYVEMRRARPSPEGDDQLRWDAWLTWVAVYADTLESRFVRRFGPEPEPFDENAHYY